MLLPLTQGTGRGPDGAFVGAEGAPQPGRRPLVPRRTVRVVIDAGDDPNLNRRVAALEAASRIVVRPNPGRSATDLVWDVLATAAGKTPPPSTPRA